MFNQSVTLNNGVEMPILGYGTFKVKDGQEVIDSVKCALKEGYRRIDTATLYNNEEGIGQAIKESGIPREEIFIATKVWNTDHGYEATLKAFETSLKNLQTDYLDLYLIHWPQAETYKETWLAFEKLYKEGKIRAIGVSNFQDYHIDELIKIGSVVPAVNQVEYHPELTQEPLIKYCQEHQIQVEAWSPLMQGRVFEIELLKELAEKYNKTIAQIVLRWNIQNHVITIPKSVKPERIRSNAEIFDFQLSEEDMKRINALNKDLRIGPDPDHPLPY